MSAEQVLPPQAPPVPEPGKYGVFLKNKGINSIALGKDADSVEMLELEVKDLVYVCKLLKESQETNFDLLILLTSLELKRGYQAIYSLHSTESKQSFRIKVTLSKENPAVPTVSHIWSTANWYEREAYDMMGIVFEGHPNLKRLLNPENWEGFPLRKDYIPPTDALNGPHPCKETELAEKTLTKPSF